VVSLEIDEAGGLRVTDVAFASEGNGNFVWVLAYEGMVPMEGEIAPEGRHLIGTLDGKLVDEAGGHHDVTIAIDAVAQPFRELPERVCP
jgi:hypothetical protein